MRQAIERVDLPTLGRPTMATSGNASAPALGAQPICDTLAKPVSIRCGGSKNPLRRRPCPELLIREASPLSLRERRCRPLGSQPFNRLRKISILSTF